MKINRVTLYNFSSYVGENTIALGTHNEQNIILIGGNNGAGKTSFFTAIKLALYGPQCFRFQDKNMIGVYFNIKYTPAYFISSGIFSVNSVARFNSSTADHPLNRSAI